MFRVRVSFYTHLIDKNVNKKPYTGNFPEYIAISKRAKKSVAMPRTFFDFFAEKSPSLLPLR
jgi:hypothetical protein